MVPTWGFIGFFLGILASPYYYATPENRWAEYFHDYIPSWMAPVDRASGLKWFFEGLPPDVAAPLSVWYVPLFWWFCFIAAVALASLCIGAMMRKQWVEYEKLDYPLIQVGIEISEKSSGTELMPEFMRGKLFWIGMTIPFGMICWNILSYFWPAAPEFPFAARNFTIATGFPWFSTNISFYTFAFSFFASLEVLFSMWFFFLIFIVQAGVLNRIGYTIGSSLDPWSSYDAITGWQSWGAFFFMVVWGLFIARKHLREVVKKALDTTYPVDDSGGDRVVQNSGVRAGRKSVLSRLLARLCGDGIQAGRSAHLVCVFDLYRSGQDRGAVRAALCPGTYDAPGGDALSPGYSRNAENWADSAGFCLRAGCSERGAVHAGPGSYCPAGGCGQRTPERNRGAQS